MEAHEVVSRLKNIEGKLETLIQRFDGAVPTGTTSPDNVLEKVLPDGPLQTTEQFLELEIALKDSEIKKDMKQCDGPHPHPQRMAISLLRLLMFFATLSHQPGGLKYKKPQKKPE